MTATFVPSRTLIHGGGSVPLSEARPGHSAMGVEMGDEDEDMDVDVMEEADEQGGASLLARRLVVPGQLVTDDPQFMRYPPFVNRLRHGSDEQWTWNIHW